MEFTALKAVGPTDSTRENGQARNSSGGFAPLFAKERRVGFVAAVVDFVALQRSRFPDRLAVVRSGQSNTPARVVFSPVKHAANSRICRIRRAEESTGGSTSRKGCSVSTPVAGDQRCGPSAMSGPVASEHHSCSPCVLPAASVNSLMETIADGRPASVHRKISPRAR